MMIAVIPIRKIRMMTMTMPMKCRVIITGHLTIVNPNARTRDAAHERKHSQNVGHLLVLRAVTLNKNNRKKIN
jgi:hypothetical protein